MTLKPRPTPSRLYEKEPKPHRSKKTHGELNAHRTQKKTQRGRERDGTETIGEEPFGTILVLHHT